MRYMVGLVLMVALVGSPVSVSAAPAQKESQELPSWLQIELHTPGLHMTYSELQQLALIPQHLQQRVPGHRTGQGDDDKAKADFEIEYVNPEEEAKRRRRRAIGLGIGIPLLVLGLSAGIAMAVFAANFDPFAT